MNAKFRPLAITLLAVFASACVIGTPALAGGQTDYWKGQPSGSTFTVLPKGASESNVPWVTSWKDEQSDGISRQTYTNLTFYSYLRSQVITEVGFDKTHINTRIGPLSWTNYDGTATTTCIRIDCNGNAQQTLIETMKNDTNIMPLWLKGTAAEAYLQSLPGSTAIVATQLDPPKLEDFGLRLPMRPADLSLLDIPSNEFTAPRRLLGPLPDHGASSGAYPDSNTSFEPAPDLSGDDYGGSAPADQGFDSSGETFGPGF